MRNILVLTPAEDHAGRAVGLAAALGDITGAHLCLLRVLEEDLRWSAPDPGRAGGPQLRDLLAEAETRALEELATPLRGRGLAVDTEVAWGVPWDAILERTERDGVDLVVKPAHGLAHGGRVFFGSTALHLFRKCPCPVWVVGDSGGLPERILAAIDPARDATRVEAARRILGRARSVAGWSGGEVSVAAAWDAPAASLLKGRIPQSELDGYREDAHERARAALGRILEAFPDAVLPERAHLLEGSAREALPRFAEEQGFDLIVMGTRGRTGLAADMLGDTAEMIIRQVHGSILTVPPGRRARED